MKLNNKMKVAFDCSGTLLTDNIRVLALFKWFEKQGCEMIIWSNSYGYTLKAKEKHNLKAECMLKVHKGSGPGGTEYVDICVDDQNQYYLAAKNIILVHDIPHPDEFNTKYNYYLRLFKAKAL